MKTFICRNYFNYYVWFSHILIEYSSICQQRFENYGHEEMRSDSPQPATLNCDTDGDVRVTTILPCTDVRQ